MRNRLFKLLACVLALGMLISAIPDASAKNVGSFTDIGGEAWYASAVEYVYNHSIMVGISDTKFSPNYTSTRAMMVSVIYRIAGSPSVSQETSFTDLTMNWYKTAISWAQKNGVAYGESNTTFNPDGNITREQLVTMLWRYVKQPTAENEQISKFSDSANVSEYAKQAMNWAIETDLICGNKNQLFPKNNATRAEMAKILALFIKANPQLAKHKWDNGIVTTAATCTTNGVMTYTCMYCDYTKKEVIVGSHQYGDWKTTTAATCTTMGAETRVCNLCDASEVRSITALGHDWQPATCQTPKTCSRCGITNGTTVEHSWEEWKVITPATCTTEGMEEHTCSVCHATNSRIINVLGHNWSDGSCTQPATCTRCGATQGTPSGHNWTEWEVKKPATCEKPGSEKRTCKNCGAEETREIKAVGHTWETVLMSDAVWTMIQQDNNPTYVRYGSYTEFTISQCSRCHDIDENTLKYIYTPYEAAEIALGYVNELRGEYYGDEDHYLVLDTTLIELANLRAKDLEIVISHYSPSGLWTNAGENVTGAGSNIKEHYMNFYNEEYHRINMVHEEYKYFGYGIYHPAGEEGWDDSKVYGAQLFWDEYARNWYFFETTEIP